GSVRAVPAELLLALEECRWQAAYSSLQPIAFGETTEESNATAPFHYLGRLLGRSSWRPKSPCSTAEQGLARWISLATYARLKSGPPLGISPRPEGIGLRRRTEHHDRGSLGRGKVRSPAGPGRRACRPKGRYPRCVDHSSIACREECDENDPRR